MTKFLLTLALPLLFFLSTPAHAQSALDDSCTAPSDDTTDYVQRGEDMIMMECPPEGGGACACHAPAGPDGKCQVYVCNADGSPIVPKPKPVAKPKEEAKPAVEKTKKKTKAKKPAATPVQPADKLEYVR